MGVVFKKTQGLTDVQTHYCPGCTHGIIHRLVGEVLEELGVVGDKLGEFKIEYSDISRAIIISAKKFLWIYRDGSIRCVYRKRKESDEENIAFFENLSRKLLA